ncbi:MAG: hypothetical protein IPN29_08350 [Saprospiraceae bacterium]|nr:hypothetical protein [Saprospiraceae bacterium]
MYSDIEQKIMKQNIFILFMVLISVVISAQNVGVGTNSPPSKLTIVGPSNSPTIPGNISTGVFRIGIAGNAGIDFGKLAVSPFSGWMQVGEGGVFTDPLSIQPLGGRVGMGTINPHASAALDVTSTTRGFLPPRMTKTQRDAIPTPLAEGLTIYNTTSRCLETWEGSQWY